MDGSPHDWFEGRAEKCTLLALIDDATSMVLGLRFCDAETTQDYFALVEAYFKQYGIPPAFYSDKHGIFNINAKEADYGTGHTQFSRAMKQLNIELILANSPQAKGRVERLNQTLQDRLIKEMRLRGISNQEGANAFLPEFIEDFNRRFAKPPKCDTNAHRELGLTEEALGHILSLQTHRKLSRNLECSYRNVTYQPAKQDRKYRMQHTSILVCENREGQVTLFHQNKELPYTTLDKQNQTRRVEDSKTLNRRVDLAVSRPGKGHKPKRDHPWYRLVRQDCLRKQSAMTE